MQESNIIILLFTDVEKIFSAMVRDAVIAIILLAGAGSRVNSGYYLSVGSPSRSLSDYLFRLVLQRVSHR